MDEQLRLEDGSEHHALSNGECWVHCAVSTAERLERAVGRETFERIELLMHGTSGWVYRDSDLPNRHGYCNSQPNPALVTSFKGFRRGAGVRKKGVGGSLMY